MHRTWKSVLVLALVAFVGPGLAAMAQDPIAQSSGDPEGAGNARPRAVIVEAVADLGDIVRGDQATHDFIIRNEGTAPLEITEVRPSCGCTVAEFDHTIPPGGTGTIHAKLDTSGIRGGASKMITVYTNDPETPELQLTMMVKVTSYLLFNPGFARFIQGHGYPPGTVEQFFYSPNFKDLAIEKVESPFPFLAVSYREARQEERRPEAEDGKQYIFTLTIDYDQAPVGPLSAEVLVYTNHPHQKIGNLPVSGFVRPRLAVTPPVADFGEFQLAAGIQARFLVNNFSPDKIRVTRVEAGLPGAQTSISTVEEGRRYHVELILPEDLPKGPFTTQVKIYTDSEKEPVLVVPLKGTVL